MPKGSSVGAFRQVSISNTCFCCLPTASRPTNEPDVLILFLQEASFLAPIRTWPPPEGPRREQLLLTVGLSSCTQIAFCSQEHGPCPEASLPASSIYAAVVAWLLALVSTAAARKQDVAVTLSWLMDSAVRGRRKLLRLQVQMCAISVEQGSAEKGKGGRVLVLGLRCVCS